MTRIVQALTIAFHFVQQPMSDLAIAEMAQELATYPEEHVLAALKRCRQELRIIKYADIIERLPGGHPGPEEAWALVAKSLRNEAVSIVWTEEMREAMGLALALGDDPVAARMAFKETYTRLVNESRAVHRQPRWSASLGYDPAGRDLAKLEADNRNRAVQGLPALFAETLALPEPGGEGMPHEVRQLMARIGGPTTKQSAA